MEILNIIIGSALKGEGFGIFAIFLIALTIMGWGIIVRQIVSDLMFKSRHAKRMRAIDCRHHARKAIQDAHWATIQHKRAKHQMRVDRAARRLARLAAQ